MDSPKAPSPHPSESPQSSDVTEVPVALPSPAGFSSAAKIELARDGIRLGAFTVSGLRELASSHSLMRSDHVFLASSREWKIIEEVASLRDVLFPEESVPPPPPPPPSPVAPPVATVPLDDETVPSAGYWMSPGWGASRRRIDVVILGGIAVLVLCFVLTRTSSSDNTSTLDRIKQSLLRTKLFRGGHKVQARACTVGWGDESNQRLNGAIENLDIRVGRDDGQVDIYFDFDSSKAMHPTGHFLVRFFDKSGEHLTHFTTNEMFVMDSSRWPFDVLRLTRYDNHLQYQISVRDAAFAEQAEFGISGGGN